MLRRLLASAALLLSFCVSAAAQAAPSDVSRYVLPPGNYGGIPTGPHSLDQLPLYSGLTPLRRNVSMGDLRRTGSIFGNGGGVEHDNSDLLARVEQSFRGRRGHAVWSDATEAND